MTQLPVAPGPTTPQQLSRDQLVASSSGWLALSLNLGCQGWGYVYQRRWGAFWIGGLSAVAAALVVGGASALLVNTLADRGLPELQEDRSTIVGTGFVFGGYVGVLAVGVGSAVEAGLAVNRSRSRLSGAVPPPAF